MSAAAPRVQTVLRRRCRFARALALALAMAASPGLAADTVLKASHQWPANVGDLRDEMLNMLADEVARADVGVRVDIFPNAVLAKPREQWEALTAGRIDITLLPLDYVSDRHPEFSVTLMPTLVRNFAHAQRLAASPFLTDIKRIIAGDGISVLADGWLAGGFASRRGCIQRPADLRGLRVRTAGPMFETMLAGAGAIIVSLPLADVFAAIASGKLDAAVTSSESLVSMQLYKHATCVTPPGERAVWFMYEPMLIATAALQRLSAPQRDALLAAARKAEAFGYERAAFSDEVLVDLYRLQGVRVATMTAEHAAEWRALSERTAYRRFAAEVGTGGELLDKALAVP